MDELSPLATGMALPGGFSFYKLEVFQTVVDRGGVARAAEALYVSQPVVSAHIRSLESRLEAKLFTKQGRKLELTEAGEATYRWAVEVFRSRVALARSLESIATGSAGHASIGSSLSVGNYIVVPALIEFKKRVPDATVELRMGSVEETLESLRAGTIDFCVIPTQAVLDARELDVEPLGVAPLALFASAQNTDIPSSLGPQELERLPFISPPSGWAIRRSQDAALLAWGVTRRITTMELGSAEAIKQAVSADLGVALLWRVSVVEELSNNLLREIEVRGATLTDSLYIVKRTGSRLSALHENLIAGLKSAISVQLGRPAAREAGLQA